MTLVVPHSKIDGHKVVALLARYLLAERQIDSNQHDLITLMTTGHLPDTPHPGAD